MVAIKSETVINWLASGVVRVHFDATRDGVVVPEHLRSDINVVLAFGLDLPKPIRDLKVDDEAISGTLSFGGYGEKFCIVPWPAVFIVTSWSLERAELWLNDAPPSVQNEILERAGESANAKVRRQSFNVIQGGVSDRAKKKKGGSS